MQVLICFDRTLSHQPQPPIHPLLAGQSPPLEPVCIYIQFVCIASSNCLHEYEESECMFCISMAVHARHKYVLSALSFLTQVSELAGAAESEGQQDVEVYT